MINEALDKAGAARIVQKLKALVAGIENYDDAVLSQKVEALKQRLDTLVGSGDASAVIDTFNEIEAFLQGITNKQTLTGLLQEMKAEITALIPKSYWHAGNDGAGSGLDADLLDGTHKSELLTGFTKSGDNNNILQATVGGTTKNTYLYPDASFGYRKTTKPDNGGRQVIILIADITEWKGSTVAAGVKGHYGFTGRVIESRVSGTTGESITDVICRVGYSDYNEKNRVNLTSSSERTKPVMVKQDDNYYLGLVVSGSDHSLIMEGMFYGCLSTFLTISYDANGKLPDGTEIVSGYTYDTVFPYNASSADSANKAGKLATTIISNKNLDEIKDDNFSTYYAAGGNGCTNVPSGVIAFHLQVIRNASGGRMQILISNEGEIYTRNFNTTWSPWRKQLSQESCPGMFIMYHRKTDGVPLLAQPSKWTALQSSGEVADGVAIIEGGKILVVAPEEGSYKWSTALKAGGAVTTTSRATALADMEGKDNTSKITAIRLAGTGYDNFNPAAANYCESYKRTIDQAILADFNWWLPSLGELMMIFANIDRLNYCLGLITGAAQIKSARYWSSTEYNDSQAWHMSMDGAAIGTADKNALTALVRPVSTFHS